MGKELEIYITWQGARNVHQLTYGKMQNAGNVHHPQRQASISHKYTDCYEGVKGEGKRRVCGVKGGYEGVKGGYEGVKGGYVGLGTCESKLGSSEIKIHP
jgi:hypothetical protein